MPDVIIWRCAAGHQCAVSQDAMRLAVIEPTCAVPSGESDICGARLVKPLRAYPLSHAAADLPVQGEPPKLLTGVWPKRAGEDTACLADLDDPTEAVQGEPRA